MTQQERLTEILMHTRQATLLANEEMQEQREMAEREGATLLRLGRLTGPAYSQVQEISLAFNGLTASLLYAGMPVSSGNEICIRIKNALEAAIADV